VICGNCGEMFDAELNRVIRVGNKFVPDVGIPTSSGSSTGTSKHENKVQSQSASSPKPRTENHSEPNRDEALNLRTESRATSKPQNDQEIYFQEPTITLPDDAGFRSDLPYGQNSEEGEWADSDMAEQADPRLFVEEFQHDSKNVSPKSPISPEFSGKTKKGRSRKRSEKSPKSSHGLDRMHRQKSRIANLIADRNNSMSTMVWSIVSIALLSMLIMQIEAFAVPKYAQATKYRPYLAAFCKLIQCELPMFEDVENLKLIHTSIDPHPSQPDAVRIQIKLINEAEHPQPYPGLQLTLTDKFRRVVGKRIYEPSVYLPDDVENKMISGRLSMVILDLAKPHENAYGFAVDVFSNT